ncbi:hypothetical protein JRQ81_012580, partial [Phrynocephalus forsythii]
MVMPLPSSMASRVAKCFRCESGQLKRGLQSVSDLLKNFKKSDQVFGTDVEAARDPGDPALEDDLDADALDKTVARDLGEFSEKLEPCRIAPASSRYEVLLSDSLDPCCKEILQEAGIRVAEKTSLSREQLLAEIK